MAITGTEAATLILVATDADRKGSPPADELRARVAAALHWDGLTADVRRRPPIALGSCPPMSEVDPIGFFEPLYVAAAERGDAVPWDRGAPHPLVAEWVADVDGAGRSALVVGSGLGRDAELLAERGFDVVAFDVSPTAIASTRGRFPDSPVRYRVANLLEPPREWHRAFDFVLESLTVQSMPPQFHADAIANVARMVAPGGALLVVATARDAAAGVPDGPPWPLTRAEVESFAREGLRTVEIVAVREPGVPARWRARFERPAAAPAT